MTLMRSLYLLLWITLTVLAAVAQETVMETECVVNADTGQQVCTKKVESVDSLSISDMLKQAFGGRNGKVADGESSSSSSFGALHDKDDHAALQQKGFLAQLSELVFNYNKSENNIEEFLQTFFSTLSEETNAGIELFQLCWQHSKRVKEQFSKYFDDIGLESFNVIQLYYYMVHEESIKNSVWKRRQHWFLPSVPIEEIEQLGDGMYLCQLSYSDTCDDVHKYAKTFRNDTWKVVDCSTKSKPYQPASYLIVPRSEPPEQDFTEAVLVIRATKDYSDFLSDALLEATEYRGAKTHQGMMESGRWLHEKYKDLLFQILKDSGKKKLMFLIVGHSLGGGAAQLTAMEFMDYDEIEVSAAGFGAPAVLTPKMSRAVAGNITTVICDADVVSRMSGASVVNAWLKVLGYNFTEPVLEDLNQIFPVIEEMVAPYGEWTVKTLASIRDLIKAQIIKDAEHQLQVRASITKPTMEQELFPAGDCIHLYRDGSAWQGVYMPCTQFDEVEVVKKMVDDHLTSTGYYFALLGYARDVMENPNWNFVHDVRDLPVQL